MVENEEKLVVGPRIVTLSKYRALIYRHGCAWAMVTKVGTSGQEGAVCIVWYSTDKCCGLYKSNNGE